MTKPKVLMLFASLSFGLMIAPATVAGQSVIKRFATLPKMTSSTGTPVGHPEGLCADSWGDIFADTFELPNANGYVQNYIDVFGHNGKLKTQTPVPTGVVPLGCIISGSQLFINDVFNGNELLYDLPLTDTSVPARTFPICGGFVGNPGPLCALNANYPGPDGRIYMTDNGEAEFGDFTGKIWVLDPITGVSSVFIAPPQLAVKSVPIADYVPTGTVLPFSANGIAFSRDGSAFYVANMSTNKIYKQRVQNCDLSTGCEPLGSISQFSKDPAGLIQGPDNMDFDFDGNLWIASGQDQHVVVLNSKGQVIQVFGSFQGFDRHGAPVELLQPSGIIFSQNSIYIGNESNQSLLPAADGIEWNELKEFTISVIDVVAVGDGGN